MGDSEDETGYPKKFYPLNRQTHPMYTRPVPKRHAYYREDDDDQEDDEIEEDQGGGVGGGYSHRGGNERFQKRLKPNKPVSGYDFAGPSSDANWRDHEAFVLLEVWGDRFLQLGRRSLRNEDWNEVAEKVSEELRSERTETQCRRMVDGLKRKYRKEKIKMEKSGSGSSKWSFFNKMDMLFGSSPKSELGLACGVDSGEFVFMNTKVYLDKSNGFDEMMDSPGDSEEDGEEEEREVEYERRRRKKANDAASYKMLADSVERFGKIYEKMEKSKKEQMKELEKMRGDFQRDLELQKKQIVERAQTEIARLREEEEVHHGDGESEDEEMENESDGNLSD